MKENEENKKTVEKRQGEGQKGVSDRLENNTVYPFCLTVNGTEKTVVNVLYMSLDSSLVFRLNN